MQDRENPETPEIAQRPHSPLQSSFRDAPVRDLIEELDPRRRLFRDAALEIWERDDEDLRRAPLPDRTSPGLQILQTAPAFRAELSYPSELRHATPSSAAYALPKRDRPALTLSKAAIAGAHLWIDPSLDGVLRHCSDAFVAQAKRRGLALPKLCRVKEA